MCSSNFNFHIFYFKNPPCLRRVHSEEVGTGHVSAENADLAPL